jgi:hypothetical protein
MPRGCPRVGTLVQTAVPRVVPKGLASPPASTAAKKDQRRLGLARSLGQHIGAESGKCLRLVQVHDAFEVGFRADPLRVVGSMAHDDATMSVGNILQVEPKRFARAETTLQHQQHERPIAQAAELLQQRADLGVIQWPRQTLHNLDTHAAPHRLLPTGWTHEWSMPLGDSRQSGIRLALDRMLAAYRPANKVYS